jgi:hypothetical protein
MLNTINIKIDDIIDIPERKYTHKRLWSIFVDETIYFPSSILNSNFLNNNYKTESVKSFVIINEIDDGTMQFDCEVKKLFSLNMNTNKFCINDYSNIKFFLNLVKNNYYDLNVLENKYTIDTLFELIEWDILP